MNTKEFKKLLKRIHHGDKSALRPIYNEYYEVMVVTARFILKNEADAQDAASDVIFKLLKTAIRHEEYNVDNVGAYMKRAVTNAAYDIYNNKRVLVDIDVHKDVLVDKNSGQDATTDYIAIRQALSELSEQDREIAIMYYFYDYKLQMISVALDIPIGTIKWKLSKIRIKLKKLLS